MLLERIGLSSTADLLSLTVGLFVSAVSLPSYSDVTIHANLSQSAWTGQQLAIIVNDRDPLSVRIADYYRVKRNIPADQVIHINLLPDSTVLSPAHFKVIKEDVDKKTPKTVQGYVLTWLVPYRVGCMSITTALAAGFDPAFCANACKETRHNPFFDSSSHKPYDDFNWRPTMVLAGKDFDETKKLIDRGASSDYIQPKGVAYLLKTADIARSSRANDFFEVSEKFNARFPVKLLEQNYIENHKNVMFYFTGLARVPKIDSNGFLPGAVADHLTSAGGMLTDSYQMSILKWLEAGATGSYGAVIEPCNFPAKFSNPAVLMDYYLQGNSLIEAYWKSVAQPGQGIFVGEPLAKPFARKPN